MGSGAFGRVVKAEAVGLIKDESVTTVAVKMVRSKFNIESLEALVTELKVMIHIGSHLNVLNLLGACTKNISKGSISFNNLLRILCTCLWLYNSNFLLTGDLFVIIEYCRYGNLLSYIIKNRHKFVNQVDSFGFLLPLNRNGECGEEESYSDTENDFHLKKYFSSY